MIVFGYNEHPRVAGHRAGRAGSHFRLPFVALRSRCILQAVALFRIRVAAMKTILVPVERRSTFAICSRNGSSRGPVWRATSKGSPSVPISATSLPWMWCSLLPFWTRLLSERWSRRPVRGSKPLCTRMQSQKLARSRTGSRIVRLGDALHEDPFIGDYGRAFDIIIVGRPGSSNDGPRTASLEEALFESGRPVLVAPPDPLPRSGGRS